MKDELYQEIGKRIRAARKQAKMTQAEVADFVGLQRTSIVNIETGLQHLPIHVLFDIAHCLGTNVAEFLPESPEDIKRIQELRHITNQIENLNKRALELRSQNGKDDPL